jgi:hypothetical protein
MEWKNKTVVYTCVTNGFDYHGEQVMIDGVDYIYFTDGIDDPPASFGWDVFHIDTTLLQDLDPRRRAKIVKVNPFFSDVLKSYGYSIWIDGGIQITSESFVPEILGHLNNGMVVSPHFDGRNCAYGEATIRPPKYANEPLDQQVDFYRQEGLPENYGLYECGVMARDMNSDDVRNVSELWLGQNLEWSYQDQVSLPYVFWKSGYVPDVLPKSFRDFNWVHVNAHRKEG